MISGGMNNWHWIMFRKKRLKTGDKMGETKEITDIWGEVKGYEYYDDNGNYSGKSLIQKRALGDDYLENYDANNNPIGTSEYSKPWMLDANGHLDNYNKYGIRFLY